MDLKGLSVSAPVLMCKNFCNKSGGTGFCECLKSESYEEYSGTDESGESFDGIESIEEEAIKKPSLWDTILEEFNEEKRTFEEWEREQEESKSEETQCEAIEYLNRVIFPVLLPAMEKMLREAQRWDAIEVNSVTMWSDVTS